MQKPVLIILAGRAYPEISGAIGDYDDWIAAGLGDALPHIVVDAREQPELPHPSDLAGVVVSGSHAMVTDCEDWSERLADWLKSSAEADLPILGICYGHQLLAHAFGGTVGNRQTGVEIGTRAIALTGQADDDELFKGLPAQFPAQLVHYQSVLGLPDGGTVLASSDEEAHQAFRVGKRAWGVQFHPEFSAEAMRGYIRQLRDRLEAPDTLLDDVSDTAVARSILQRFSALCAVSRSKVG